MEYHEAANFLFGLRRFEPRAGTDATRDLLAHLGDPHESVTYVQVAGSNGKGSTTRMVEQALREAGLDVGRYTSPHLDDLRERVTVNGRPVTKAAVCAFVEECHEWMTDRAADGESPTFFETITALALWEIGRQDVDVAVLEVGIGGRYDATSVVDPLAAAVTSVTLEHTDVLGDTIEEIATDKAHVAPADRPLVTGATGDALAAVREVAGDVVTVGGEDADVTAAYRGREGIEGQVELAGPDWQFESRVALLGAHQARNAGVAVVLAEQVADALGVDLQPDVLARGLRSAHWPGRFEVMDRAPLVVLDGAHNPGGCEAVAETLASFEYDGLHLVVGAMSDKDHEGMAAALPTAARVIATRPDVARAEDEAAVAAAFRAAGHGDVTTRHAVADALADALADADPGDCVLVTGSLFAVAEARRRWTRVEVPKRLATLAESRDALSAADVTEAGVWRMRAKGVHRTLRVRLQPRQAEYVKQELLSLGGECAISGVTDQEELVDALLTGTLAQFRRLCAKLDGQPYGLGPLATDLRSALDIQTERERRGYPWEDRTAVMGILNVTPDSFHDGGRYDGVEAAVAHAREMVEAGADVVDVGGESTRPGAEPVPVDVERERVVPVIERLADLDALVSIDTRRAAVARAALAAGADVLNDVSGLADPEMRLVAAEHDAPVIVMHSLGAPVDPTASVEYDDVVQDVLDALAERVLLAEKAGLDRSQIIVDPGLGFGKSRRENFELLGRLEEFHALGCPVLVGHSHKSMFDLVESAADHDHPAPTVAATALAAEHGADIVRVHDVAENVAAIRTQAAADDPDGA
ncbi:MAG: dihydropteroate synthase [Haloarculaceae archaeon]